NAMRSIITNAAPPVAGVVATIAAGLILVPPATAQDPAPVTASKPASEATKAANAALLQELPFAEETAFEQAHKGFVAPLPQEVIKGQGGNVIWDPAKYAFIKEG